MPVNGSLSRLIFLRVPTRSGTQTHSIASPPTHANCSQILVFVGQRRALRIGQLLLVLRDRALVDDDLRWLERRGLDETEVGVADKLRAGYVEMNARPHLRDCGRDTKCRCCTDAGARASKHAICASLRQPLGASSGSPPPPSAPFVRAKGKASRNCSSTWPRCRSTAGSSCGVK